GESSGVTRQLFGPEGLLVGEAGMDLLQSLGQGGDIGSGMRVEAEVHEKSFQSSRDLLSSDRIDSQAASGSPFWERTRRRSQRRSIASADATRACNFAVS